MAVGPAVAGIWVAVAAEVAEGSAGISVTSPPQASNASNRNTKTTLIEPGLIGKVERGDGRLHQLKRMVILAVQFSRGTP